MSAVGALNLLIYVIIVIVIIVVLLYVLKVVLGVFLIAPAIQVSATFPAYTETGSTSYISVIDTDTSHFSFFNF